MPRNPSTVGAHGPVKPFEFALKKPSTLTPPIYGDDSDSWWAGRLMLVAAVAFATWPTNAVAIGKTSYSGGPIFSQAPANEDYWQNQVRPVQWDNVVSFGVSSGSAGSTTPPTVPEDPYWQNPVPPIYSYPVGIVYTDDEVIVSVATTPANEDYWQNPVPPVPATLTVPQTWQDEQTPFLFGQQDEDFWNSGVVPVPLAFVPLYLPDPEQYPTLYGLPDEVFWISGVTPQLWTLGAQAAPVSDEDSFVAPAATAPANEDYWQNWVPPDNGPACIAFGVSAASGGMTPSGGGGFAPDEYFYFPPYTLSDTQTLWTVTLWLDDGNAVPQFQDEEGIWVSGVVPQLWSVPTQPIFVSDDDSFPIQQSAAPANEDYWQNPVAPVNNPAVISFGVSAASGGLTPSTQGQPDEDFWQNQVLPVPLSFIVPQPWIYDEQTPALSTPPMAPDEYFYFPPYTLSDVQTLWTVTLFLDDGNAVPQFQDEEGVWASGVAPQLWPVPQQPTFLSDDDNFPTPQTPAPADEIYWQNPVAPVQAILAVPQPWIYDEQIPTGNLFGLPEEYYWQNPVAPVNWIPDINVVKDMFGRDEITIPPPAGTQNYINTGWHNFVSQDIGFGIEF